MGMPASSAVLNRFPGLQLKAWALFNSAGVINASSGVSTVVIGSGTVTVTLSSGVNGGVYAVDFQTHGVHAAMSTVASATVFSLSTSNQAGGAATASGGYVAIYAP
jgi:hypothetical protein